MMTNYRPLAWVSPSGERFEFRYNGDISDDITHNLGAFSFSGKDGNYYQDRSITTGIYTFLVIISDQDELKRLRVALEEKVIDGTPGSLEHPDPTIGTFPVAISTAKITQNSVSKSGVARVTIDFLKQIPNLIGGDPAESNNPASGQSTAAAIEQLNLDQASDLSDIVDATTGSGIAAFVTSAIDSANAIKNRLEGIAAKVDAINTQFTNAYAEIVSTMDELVRAPFTLARQIQNLCQLPMIAIDSVQDRISAYVDLINDMIIFSASDSVNFENGTPAGKNIAAVKAMTAMAAVSAINYSAVSGKSINLQEAVSGTTDEDLINTGNTTFQSGYLSRSQIVETIEKVQNSALLVSEVFSELAENFGGADIIFFRKYIDYSITNKNLITATTRNLNNRVFSAKKELIIITEKEENIVPLCARLYNSVEISILNFFVVSNNLHGKELYIVPKGREVVYYR